MVLHLWHLFAISQLQLFKRLKTKQRASIGSDVIFVLLETFTIHLESLKKTETKTNMAQIQ